MKEYHVEQELMELWTGMHTLIGQNIKRGVLEFSLRLDGSLVLEISPTHEYKIQVILCNGEITVEFIGISNIKSCKLIPDKIFLISIYDSISMIIQTHALLMLKEKDIGMGSIKQVLKLLLEKQAVRKSEEIS